MREIKFRFIEKDNARILDDIDVLELTVNQSLKSDEEWEVQQYTGLKDKNGREIYEGDLVKLAIAEDKYTKPLQVVYSNITACFTMGRKYHFTAMNEVEIVGNIYENKELLDAK